MFVYYRPQRSCGQGNIFAPVCHSIHRGGVCSRGVFVVSQTPPRSRHPLGADAPEQTLPGSRHPPEQIPPPRADPPWSRQPLPEQSPPQEQTPSPLGADTPREADSGIRSTSGRYASYWNAFLLVNRFDWYGETSFRALNVKCFQMLQIRVRHLAGNLIKRIVWH